MSWWQYIPCCADVFYFDINYMVWIWWVIIWIHSHVYVLLISHPNFCIYSEQNAFCYCPVFSYISCWTQFIHPFDSYQTAVTCTIQVLMPEVPMTLCGKHSLISNTFIFVVAFRDNLQTYWMWATLYIWHIIMQVLLTFIKMASIVTVLNT